MNCETLINKSRKGFMNNCPLRSKDERKNDRRSKSRSQSINDDKNESVTPTRN
jgi:hypothetical protein